MKKMLFLTLPLAAALLGSATALPTDSLTTSAPDPALAALRVLETRLDDLVLPDGCKVTISQEPLLNLAPLLDGGEVSMLGGDLGAEGSHTLCIGEQELLIVARHAADTPTDDEERHFIETDGSVSYEVVLLTRMATPEVSSAMLSLPAVTAAATRRRRAA